MKRFYLSVLLVLASFLSYSNAVLTLAGSSTIQSGVPLSLDVTFSNVSTALGITHVKLVYTITTSPSCVLPSNFKTIGGTYWGNGVGSNPPLVNVTPGVGLLFPITTNMLPMYSGMSANAILNVITERGDLPNGSTMTINAVANYYTSATATSPVFTENTNSITATFIATNQITASINSTPTTIAMGVAKVYNLHINSSSTLGSLNFYATGQNLTFNYPSCASVFNVYDVLWNPVTFSIPTPGALKFNSENIFVGGGKVFHVVLNFPCPGVSPCVFGSNVSTSFQAIGNDFCGNLMSFSSPTNNALISTACPIITTPIGPPSILPSSTSGVISPGICDITNMVEIQNMTTTTYANSNFQYTMPNSTNINSISFSPAIPTSTNLQITYSGVGCYATPFNTILTSPIFNYYPPSSVNMVPSSCTSKTISMNFPSPMIVPFSNQKIFFNYSVSSTAPVSGVASFPFIFNSSTLSGPVSIPTTIPYLPLVPNVGLTSEIFNGTNCLNSDYFNPGQSVLFRLKVQGNNSVPINNFLLNDVLNPNLSFDPTYGVNLYVGNTFSCSGLSFVNAPMNPVGSNYASGLVNVSGVSLSSNFNTTSNILSVASPSLTGAFSCSNPEFLIIEFKARVKPGTPVGSYPNAFSVHGTNLSWTASSSAFVIVNSFYELTLRMKAKRDNGMYTTNLTTCVCQSSLDSNANKITYRGELINTGNVGIKNITFFNMKPKVGDLTFPSCATFSRGTSSLVNGLTCYNNPYNMTNNAYSLVPLNYPNANKSGFLYSGGLIPSGIISANYYAGGSPIFNSPQLPLCTVCPTCSPVSTPSTPVHFGTAKYTFTSPTPSSSIVLGAGQSISFFVNPVCLQKLPTGTNLINDFFVQGLRQDLNINTPILKSNPCIVTINTGSCPSTNCDSSIVKKIIIVNEYGRYYFRIWNRSGSPVHKVKIEIMPGGCFSSYYTYTQILSTPLAPWAYIDIVNSIAGFPNLPYGPCTVNYKTTLYSLTSTGVPATYDSCSRTSNWIQYPSRIKSNEDGLTNHSDEIQLYPVPAGNYIMLNTSSYFNSMQLNELDLEMMIYDVSGHLIMKKHCNKTLEEIDIHHLKTGLYFYTLIEQGEVIHRSTFLKE